MLENVDRSHLVLGSGKPVSQKYLPCITFKRISGRWTFNPAVLTKVSGASVAIASVVGASSLPGNTSEGSQQFAVGDLVQICSDIERMKVNENHSFE